MSDWLKHNESEISDPVKSMMSILGGTVASSEIYNRTKKPFNKWARKHYYGETTPGVFTQPENAKNNFPG